MHSRSAASWVVTLVGGLVLGVSAAHGAPPVVVNPACGDLPSVFLMLSSGGGCVTGWGTGTP